jgi:thymidylate synthase (FAD)
MIDILTRVPEHQINCLDKGLVRIVDVMPRLVPEYESADHAITQAARNSYKDGTKTVNEDMGLVRFLARHRHTTPTEMVEFKFQCKMPIMVARQWIRHRTANVNEMSGRYSQLPNDFYIPDLDNVRKQSTKNKQMTDEVTEHNTAHEFLVNLEGTCSQAYQDYEDALEKGIGREQARMILPINLYTEWYWKIDLHNLLHFLALRCDAHAQWEIRVFADAMLKLITPCVPWAIEAWEDYHPMRKAVLLSRLEVEALQRILQNCPIEQLSNNGMDLKINSDNKREQQEWVEKAKKLGLIVA